MMVTVKSFGLLFYETAIEVARRTYDVLDELGQKSSVVGRFKNITNRSISLTVFKDD